jgi:RHS repeat-associated protein
VVFTWDSALTNNTGRLLNFSVAGQTYDYGYDSFGRRTSVSGAGQSISWGYLGNRVSSTTPAGALTVPVSRTYDDDHRVSSLQVGSRTTRQFFYDGDGLIEAAGDLVLERDVNCDGTTGAKNGKLRRTRINNYVDACFDYDNFGALQAISANRPATSGGSPVNLFTTTFSGRDRLGRVTAKTETVVETTGEVTTRTLGYAYTAEGFLKSVTLNGSVVAQYTYDGTGNRKSAQPWGEAAVPQGQISHDAQDRLTRYGSTLYNYALDGSLTAKCERDATQTVDACLTGTTTSYNYDPRGGLVSVARPGQPLIEYILNPTGRRIGKRVGGTVTQTFLYDEGALLPVAELNASGNVVAEFVYGTRTNVPDFVIWNGQTYRIVTDQLGSPRLVFNTASPYEVVQRLDYNEYGKVMRDDVAGAWAGASGYRLPFGFAGGLYDKDTGLVRFGARDYDPNVGRWVSKDPIRFDGGANLYAYVGNDPVNLIDPHGEAAQAAAAAAFPLLPALGIGVGLYCLFNSAQCANLIKEVADDVVDACSPRSPAPPDCGQVREDCIADCTARVLETPWRRNRDRGPDFQKCVQSCLRSNGC